MLLNILQTLWFGVLIYLPNIDIITDGTRLYLKHINYAHFHLVVEPSSIIIEAWLRIVLIALISCYYWERQLTVFLLNVTN